MAPTPVVFMGTPAFAVPSLLALIGAPELYRVVAVVTQPDRPAGRGRKLAPSAVRACAQVHNIPVVTPRRMRAPETLATLAGFGGTLFVVAAYGRILPPALLQLAPLGCINVHASLLPRFRGASPIARAIWAGDEQTGVCIMGMEEGLDTGPVYLPKATAIGAHETCGALTERLAHVGAQALMEALPGIVAGTLRPVPQPNIGVSHAPPLQKEDGLLDFTQNVQALRRQILALSPWPGTYSFLGDQRIGIVEATVESSLPANALGGASPGQVVQADARGLVVACGQGALRLEQVKPAGKAQMAAVAWISGRGPKKGATLQRLPQPGS